ncbi:hypothetical protein GQ42DRAFT_24487 [Ramicandelaber brevisporus]|nr:hypothetical protein GQ42DRAFT_24487 [Ramicandelaber brevisporus]
MTIIPTSAFELSNRFISSSQTIIHQKKYCTPPPLASRNKKLPNPHTLPLPPVLTHASTHASTPTHAHTNTQTHTSSHPHILTTITAATPKYWRQLCTPSCLCLLF